MKFSGKVWSDHTFPGNFGSIRVNGSSDQRSSCLLSPAIAQRTELWRMIRQYHSLGGTRGRGLLCLAPQLVLVVLSSHGRQFIKKLFSPHF